MADSRRSEKPSDGMSQGGSSCEDASEGLGLLGLGCNVTVYDHKARIGLMGATTWESFWDVAMLRSKDLKVRLARSIEWWRLNC